MKRKFPIGPRRDKDRYSYQFKLLNSRAIPQNSDKRIIRKLGYRGKRKGNAFSVIRNLRLINEILKEAYGTPSLGNIPNPIDEFVYITISQMTELKIAQRVFMKLKDRLRSWNMFLENEEIAAEILKEGGRGDERLKILSKCFTKIIEKYGKVSLDSLVKKKTEEIKRVLIEDLGIGEKTAYCIILYSFERSVFPVDSNIIRIMKRLNFLDNIIELEKGHKEAQSTIAQLVPQDICRTLHINMVVHGRTVCKSKKPNCHICPIHKFCQFGIDKIHQEPSSSALVAVDLFAGPGGLSLGFSDAGWNLAYAIEMDDSAAETFRFNHPNTCLVQKDITNLRRSSIEGVSGDKNIDAILAGVPCQGFSIIGYRVRTDLENRPKTYEDPRNNLYRQVFRIVKIHRPKVVVFENVPGMSSGRIRVKQNGRIRNVTEVLSKQFEKLKYRCAEVTLDASKYGVPQKRRRLFVIGSRIGDPKEIIQAIERKANKASISTLGDTISSLPELTANDGIPIVHMGEHPISDDEAIWGPSKPRHVIIGHVSRPHNEYDMKIIRALDQGMTYKTLYETKPEIIESRRKGKLKVYSTSNFHDKFFRLQADEPSRTIVSHLAKDGNSFIHPKQDRSLTPREAARLQSFPDDYIFFGSRSSQFIQIGNAVPPPLARVIAESLREHIVQNQ